MNMLKRQLKLQGKKYLQGLIAHHQNLVNLKYSTIVGVRCLDGIVLGTEKIIFSKMMISGTDKRIFSATVKHGAVRMIVLIEIGCKWLDS